MQPEVCPISRGLASESEAACGPFCGPGACSRSGQWPRSPCGHPPSPQAALLLHVQTAGSSGGGESCQAQPGRAHSGIHAPGLGSSKRGGPASPPTVGTRLSKMLRPALLPLIKTLSDSGLLCGFLPYWVRARAWGPWAVPACSSLPTPSLQKRHTEVFWPPPRGAEGLQSDPLVLGRGQ